VGKCDSIYERGSTLYLSHHFSSFVLDLFITQNDIVAFDIAAWEGIALCSPTQYFLGGIGHLLVGASGGPKAGSLACWLGRLGTSTITYSSEYLNEGSIQHKACLAAVAYAGSVNVDCTETV
jgi:hypothetical protein